MNRDYEFFETLGAHHPIEVELTVAQAEHRERLGIPLPVSGDPTSDRSRELLTIRRRRASKAWASDLSTHIEQLEVSTAKFIEDMAGAAAAAPVVETEAAGLNFLIEGTQIRLAVVPVAGGSTVVALIDSGTGQAALLPLSEAALVGNHLARIAQTLQHDEVELRGLGRPAMGVRQLRDRLSQMLDGGPQVPGVCVVGIGGETSQFSGFPGFVARSVEAHNSSPSVGAPSGAVRDTSNPTEGDLPRDFNASRSALAAMQRRLMIGGRLAVAS
jgi:hypothetical protein